MRYWIAFEAWLHPPVVVSCEGDVLTVPDATHLQVDGITIGFFYPIKSTLALPGCFSSPA